MLRLFWITVVTVFTGIAPIFSQFYGSAYFDSTFTGYFRRNSGGWTAGDATISIPLSDKRVIWLFGDSYIVDVDTSDNTLPCLFQIRNCMMVQDSADRNHFITYIDSTETGINRTTFKIPGSSQLELLWPDHGFEYQDTVFIFFEHLDSETLELLGIYVARLLMPGLQLLNMQLMPDKGDIAFGRYVLTDSVAGYRYIYGNKVNWIVWEPFVARCPLDGLFGPWEYWTGTGWSEYLMMIGKISDLPVSPNFSVLKIAEKYYLITQENGYLTCGLGREIYSYESDSPTGPFVNQTLLYTEESMIGDRYLLTYNAMAHPEFTGENELLVSYNVNDLVDTVNPYLCPSQCVNVWTDRMDADSYRPKFIRVPLGLITKAGQESGIEVNCDIYPNPAKAGQKIYFKLQKNTSGPLEIDIADLAGKEILHCIPDENNYFTSPSTPGYYFIKSTATERTFYQKLLIIR